MMKRDQFLQVGYEFNRRQPFRPFVIELDDGERLPVYDPTMLSVYTGNYFPPDGSIVIIDWENVARFVDLAEEKAS